MWASRWHAGGADALGVEAGLLVALDHRHRHFAAQQVDGAGQQGGFAGAGAGNQVQGENAVAGKILAVGLGVGVVLGQDVLFHQDPTRGFAISMIMARAAEAWAARAMAVRVGLAADFQFAATAAAGCAHLVLR
jgi:hypothetical protein